MFKWLKELAQSFFNGIIKLITRSNKNDDKNVDSEAVNSNPEQTKKPTAATAIVRPLSPKFLADKNEKGNTVLHKAVIANNVGYVRSILGFGINVDVQNKYKMTPLHIAATKIGDILGLLIGKKAAVNPKNNEGDTPLHLAVRAGIVENVKLLIANGAMVFEQNQKGDTPLHCALTLSNPDVDIIEALIGAPTSIVASTMLNWESKSPGFLAVSHPKVNDLRLAQIEYLVSITTIGLKTQTNSTILHAATENKQLSEDYYQSIAARCFTYNPLILNAADTNGYTALARAVESGNDKRIDLLLSYNPQLDVESASASPLLVAARKNNTERAIQFLKSGANPKAVDRNNKTALIYAAAHGNLKLIEALEEQKIAFNNAEAQMALRVALVNNHPKVALKLLEYGVDPATSFTLAVRKEKSSFNPSSIASYTEIENDGHDKTGFIKTGDTPLHFAVKTRNFELIEACLKNNPAAVNVPNKAGESPASFAFKILDQEVAHCLYKNGDRIDEKTSEKASSLFGDTVVKRLEMKAAKRHFSDYAEMWTFFKEPAYTLSPAQETFREAKLKKHGLPMPTKDAQNLDKEASVIIDIPEEPGNQSMSLQ